MGKYLKKFQNHSQYQAYVEDIPNFIRPNVSICIQQGDVHYNPVLSMDDAIITCDPATYTGEAQTATNITVVLNNYTLVNGTDYTVDNEGGTNAGDYTFTINGIGNYKDSKDGTLTIAKVTPTVVVPTANVLTYNGSAQELVTAGSTNWGTLKYSLDGETYSTSIPTATSYGNYTVYYKVEGDSNINDVAPATILCSINEKQVTATVELSQDTYTYDGTAKTPVVVVKDGDTVIDPSEYTVTYSNNTNAGDGTATVIISDNVGGNYEVVGSTTFTINKANPTYTAPTAKNTTYSGGAQALLNAGSTDYGTIYYSSNGTDWSSTIPSQTNAGTYTSYWKLDGGSNYNSVNSTSISTTISKANQSAPSASGSTTTYPTTATASASGGSGIGGLVWESAQSQTSVGSHTTRARWAGNANYNSSGWSNYVTVQMNKANQSAPTAYGSTTTYPTAATASASGGGGAGSIVWESAQSQTSVGSHTTRCYWSGDANYNASGWSNYVTVQMNKASQSAPTAYGGSASYPNTATASASGGGGQGSIEWSNGSSRSAIGTQTTQARWSGNGNYNASDWSNTVPLTVGRASQSAPTATGSSVSYGNTATASASGGGGQGSIEWSNGNTRTAVGSQTTKARWTGNDYYLPSEWSNEVTLEVTTSSYNVYAAINNSTGKTSPAVSAYDADGHLLTGLCTRVNGNTTVNNTVEREGTISKIKVSENQGPISYITLEFKGSNRVNKAYMPPGSGITTINVSPTFTTSEARNGSSLIYITFSDS